MSSIQARIEIYHHDSDNIDQWSYGCPELGLMGYKDIVKLVEDIALKSTVSTGVEKDE